MKSIVLSFSLIVLNFAAVAAVTGFPQSPVIYYGLVRDEYGSPLKAASDVRLDLVRNTQRSGTVYATCRVSESGFPGMNYRLSLEIDSSGPVREKAVTAGKFMFIKAVQGGASVNLSPEPVLETPAQGTKVRMDFTIGEDADHDGIPDAWEEWQLDLAGRDSSSEAIAAFRPEDDADGDGFSNLSEYLAGTNPFDATELFAITDFKPVAGTELVKVTVPTVPNRSYRLLYADTADSKQWYPAPSSIKVDAEPAYDSYKGSGHDLTIYTDARLSSKFFKMAVD